MKLATSIRADVVIRLPLSALSDADNDTDGSERDVSDSLGGSDDFQDNA